MLAHHVGSARRPGQADEPKSRVEGTWNDSSGTVAQTDRAKEAPGEPTKMVPGGETPQASRRVGAVGRRRLG